MMVNWPIWMESGFCGDVRILKCRGEAVVGGRERGTPPPSYPCP